MRFKLRRPSAPTVISLLALFIALGGSATAGVMITKSSQLGKNVVTGAKIKKGSISSGKLSKKTRAQLRRGLGIRGLSGDKGPAGATGSKGPQGDPGVGGVDGQTGDKGPRGDIGPSAIALIGRIEIINSLANTCGWKEPGDYLVPEGREPPSLTWDGNGKCKLQFASGSNVKWATAQAQSSETSWSKVEVDSEHNTVNVSLLDFPANYGTPPVPSQGTAYVVVYSDPS